jgi:hypothetical protein
VRIAWLRGGLLALAIGLLVRFSFNTHPPLFRQRVFLMNCSELSLLASMFRYSIIRSC